MDLKVWQNHEVTIHVDYDPCQGHSSCVQSCPGEVYELKDDKAAAVNIDDCIQCCTCVEVCPVKAIQHSACD